MRFKICGGQFPGEVTVRAFGLAEKIGPHFGGGGNMRAQQGNLGHRITGEAKPLVITATHPDRSILKLAGLESPWRSL